MRDARREAWEIIKVWWLFVPGGALGVVAIVEVVHDAHGKSFWFWGFCAMTALFLATCWRLRGVVRERNAATQTLSSENSAEAVAKRLEQFAHEGDLLKDEIPADAEPFDWFQLRSRKEAELEHLALRIERELRLHFPKFLPYWKTNPDDLPTGAQLASAANARRIIEFGSEQLRHIAERLRAGHDEP
jgi:hypothetical protein